MAEVWHSSTSLLAAPRVGSSGRRAGEFVRLPTSCLTSRFWGDSRHLSLRLREQQHHHLQRLKPVQFHVMNTAPWLRWWDKDGAPNMVEIHSMQEFVEALSNAGDELVIVDFYARHCNACRTLYPKLCKVAREHPDVVFLKINYDENSDICKALNVKVLPLFFVYRAQGHLESFTCTISKIQRLRDAIAKYSTAVIPDSTSVPAVVGSLLAKAKASAGSFKSSSSQEAVAI